MRRQPEEQHVLHPKKELYRGARFLGFPDAIEREFGDYYYARTLLFVRLAIIVGVVLYLLNIITDISLFPHLAFLSICVRVGFSLFGLTILILTFFKFFKPYQQYALFVISVTASCGIVVFTYVGSGVPALLYHSGAMLCMMFTFSFIKIKFKYAAVSGWIVVLSYIVPHALLGDIAPNDLFHNSMNLVGIVIVGMAIAYMDEYAARYTFVQSLVIRDSNRALLVRNETIEKDLEMAKNIQEHYMPRRRPAEYLSAWYRPMEKIGGDFYEFIPFDDPGTIGIFISDVSGHGVQAALIATMLKITLSSVGELKNDPPALLTRVNDLMHRNIGQGYITCIYGIVDRGARTLRYSCAGHYPPYIIARGSIEALAPFKSMPLGVQNTAGLKKMGREFVEQRVTLPPRSKLILYTDGVTEAQKIDDDTRVFEYCGMREAMTGLSGATCEDFTRGLYDALVAFRGSETFDDDICIICVDVD